MNSKNKKSGWVIITDSDIKSIINISGIKDIEPNCYGFIYKITNVDNGKIYIGRKTLMSRRKKNFGKKKLSEMTDKRLKTYEYIEKESDWLTYTGSNKTLNGDIKSGDKVIKEIIHFCKNKSEMTYFETKYQFIHSVLETDNYNDNILGKFYKRIFEDD